MSQDGRVSQDGRSRQFHRTRRATMGRNYPAPQICEWASLVRLRRVPAGLSPPKRNGKTAQASRGVTSEVQGHASDSCSHPRQIVVVWASSAWADDACPWTLFVGLFHPLLHAGFNRRSLRVPRTVLRTVVRDYACPQDGPCVSQDGPRVNGRKSSDHQTRASSVQTKLA